jgi:hypothetical protein
MKTKLIVLMISLLVSNLAVAHDPKEHAKESEAPDCQILASMDHEKMDMDDPVMQAMYARCKMTMTDHLGDGKPRDKHMDNDMHAMEEHDHD